MEREVKGTEMGGGTTTREDEEGKGQGNRCEAKQVELRPSHTSV